MFEEDNLKITAISMIDQKLEYKGDRKKSTQKHIPILSH